VEATGFGYIGSKLKSSLPYLKGAHPRLRMTASWKFIASQLTF
jgi:hypothetical protein